MFIPSSPGSETLHLSKFVIGLEVTFLLMKCDGVEKFHLFSLYKTSITAQTSHVIDSGAGNASMVT
uniref:Uncharacterized protein n=1 Tax=Anguilla anguilla TaxID=7936 RepID=A0A0E9TRM7_ANGAN